MSDNFPHIDDDLILIEFTDSQGGFVQAGLAEDLEKYLKELDKLSQQGMDKVTNTIHATARQMSHMIVAMQTEAAQVLPDDAEITQAFNDAQRKAISLTPNEVELEFTIKLEVSGKGETPTVVNAFIAKAEAGGSASGQFAVKLKWNIEKPITMQTLINKQA